MKDVEDFYPLSPLQQGILFHTLYTPNTRVYFHQFSYTLEGGLDVAAFRRAWQRVVDRHPILRSSFVWGNLKEPVQIVRRNIALAVEEHDWRGLPFSDQQTRIEALAREDRERGFDLSRAPLLRLTLARLTDDSHQLIWSYHHIILDGWSGERVNQEVMTFYKAFASGRDEHLPAPRPYRDYIVWLRRQDLARAESFWRRTLSGFTSPTPLALDRTTHMLPDREEGYGEMCLSVPAGTTAALQSLAQRNKLTLNTVVQGIWALLLSRYSGEPDVVFGVVVSGRPPELLGFESMVGLFINTLPMRAQVTPEAPVLVWLKELQVLQVEMQQYEYSPLMEVQRWSEMPAGQPLFESIFAFENYHAGLGPEDQTSGVTARNVRGFERTHYPLTFMVAPGPELALKILFDSRCLSASAVARMLEHFRALAESVVAHAGGRVSDLSIAGQAESEQLISGFSDGL